MIQLLSKLKVADNSGARLVQCIKVLKSRAKTATVGDLITVTVKKARPHKQVQKKDVRVAVIVRTKSTYLRPNGMKVSLGENACVILNSRVNKTPIGTRILGPIPIRELRKSKIMKCLLLAKSSV
jgi:large subunit ribosomal protein L14